jgi:hypothetical protein
MPFIPYRLEDIKSSKTCFQEIWELKKPKSDGLDLRTSEERGDAQKHFFLQQLGDRHSNKGAIGKIGKKATKA